MDSLISKEQSTSCDPSMVVMSDDSGVMCSICSTIFPSLKLLNRHKQRIHQITVSDSRRRHVICPLCEEKQELKTHKVLRKHLEEEHAVNIEILTFKFSSVQEYELWKNEEFIDTGYAIHRTKRCNNYKEVNYICNRSNYKGYQANYQKRKEKSGGTIRIPGMCPSKLNCKLYDNGSVSIDFWTTHVGHELELRSLHLSKAEKEIVVNKMKSGVSINRILEDARNLKGPEPQIFNLINRKNIIYLTKKFNIDKNGDHNEMVAAALEWNEKEVARFVEIEIEHQEDREDKWTNFKNWVELLDDEVFNRFMNDIQGAINVADQAKQRLSNKRKMETQKYFPNKTI